MTQSLPWCPVLLVPTDLMQGCLPPTPLALGASITWPSPCLPAFCLRSCPSGPAVASPVASGATREAHSHERQLRSRKQRSARPSRPVLRTLRTCVGPRAGLAGSGPVPSRLAPSERLIRQVLRGVTPWAGLPPGRSALEALGLSASQAQKRPSPQTGQSGETEGEGGEGERWGDAQGIPTKEAARSWAPGTSEVFHGPGRAQTRQRGERRGI